MRYSVWNQAKRQYDYYEAVGQVQKQANTPKPTHIPDSHLGVTVDMASWPVPKNAKLVGSGQKAIGRVGTRNARNARSGLSGFIDGANTSAMIMLAIAGLVLFKVAKDA